MEKLLQSIIEGVSNNYGEQFFNTICLKMHDAIAADYTFIARLDTQAYVSRTIALVADNQIVENMEYSLEHTPCADVADDSVCLYPENITHLFPQDQLLIDMGIEGYIGTPLHDSQGKVMGLTVALYKAPIKNAEFTETLFKIFSGRISAEIERTEYEQTLEQKVAERTTHLEEALSNLKKAQAQLVQQEKLASLGGVVAGVAHEVNTPMGITKTAHTLHESKLNELCTKFTDKTMTRSDLERYIKDTKEINHTITLNLERSIDLIQNFKHAAVNRIDEAIHTHNLLQLIEQLTFSMSAEFQRIEADCLVNIPKDLEITTRGSDLSQVVGNLLINACIHAFNTGFSKDSKPTVKVTAQATNGEILLKVSDNGVGVEKSIRKNVFDPFVTTKRKEGGTGLGMNIVFNQVTSALNGRIELNQDMIDGTEWIITLPMKLIDSAQ